jgi:methionyl-tRNA formyltransferase
VRIALAAEDAAGVQTLKALQQRGHDLVAVMATPMNDQARGTSVWRVASEAGHETWDAQRLADPAFGDVLRERRVDLFLNVYSLIIADTDVLNVARYGSFNLHPGPLPAYAGLNSVSWAIYNGEHSHGVTLHRMESEVDTGAIAFQEIFPIRADDTGLTVSSRCVRIGVEMVTRLVETLERDPRAVPSLAQDLGLRSFYGGGVPRRGRLSWQEPAASVVDFVRACDYHPLSSPWDLPRATLAGREVAVTKAERTHEATHEAPGSTRLPGGPSVLVACADEWISVSQVRVDGRRCSPAEALEQSGDSEGGSR